MAAEWAAGKRSPHDPPLSVDGQPPNDFSKSIERFTAKGVKRVEAEEALLRQQISANAAYSVPNACGTCLFFQKNYYTWDDSQCTAFAKYAVHVRNSVGHCNNGEAWRPSSAALKQLRQTVIESRPGFLSRLAEALLDRISGRYRLREIEQSKRIEPPQRSTVVKIEDGAKSKKS